MMNECVEQGRRKQELNRTRTGSKLLGLLCPRGCWSQEEERLSFGGLLWGQQTETSFTKVYRRARLTDPAKVM